MRKDPKKPGGQIRFLVGGIKFILVAEVAGLGIFYFFWRKMNTSQDYRYKMYNKFPYLLSGYYSIGKYIGGLETQSDDYKAWGISEGKS